MAFRYIASTLLERMTGKVFWHKDWNSYRWSEEILGSIGLRLNQWISYYLRQVGDISQVMAGISESNSIGTHGFEEKLAVSRFDGWRAEDTSSARMVLTCSFCTCLFCPPRSSCHLGVCFTSVCLSVPFFWENFVVFLFVGRIREMANIKRKILLVQNQTCHRGTSSLLLSKTILF